MRKTLLVFDRFLAQKNYPGIINLLLYKFITLLLFAKYSFSFELENTDFNLK